MAQLIRNAIEKAPVLLNAAATYSKPRLVTFWQYAKVELVPPSPTEIPRAIESLKKIISSARTGSFKNLTVKNSKGITAELVHPHPEKLGDFSDSNK
ncbi:ATP synthase subunit g, mitochondrial isoform X2 [Notamacropus eugenii]|uniref:ATP synthase subunit g, mitochondrial isoform X2 n=1 Tax=Notamacropus eugenii TaxID=9315 RepID=UPI003B682217